MNERLLRILLPAALLAIAVVAWQATVVFFAIPPYVLPAPSVVASTLVADWPLLADSLWATLVTTFQGFALAAVGGIALAVLFNYSRVIEYSLYPYAVILQVTPVVAVAPLLLIYLPQHAAVLACAWIVAFFPVLANTTLGLNSVDHNLTALFELYRASRWRVLWNLKLPAALPQMLAGLRIAGGLSLIGAVVAEIAAGSAGAGSGLAYRIAESGYRLNIPRMFAALVLLSAAGIVIFFVLSLVTHLGAAALARKRAGARALAQREQFGNCEDQSGQQEQDEYDLAESGVVQVAVQLHADQHARQHDRQRIEIERDDVRRHRAADGKPCAGQNGRGDEHRLIDGALHVLGPAAHAAPDRDEHAGQPGHAAENAVEESRARFRPVRSAGSPASLGRARPWTP